MLPKIDQRNRNDRDIDPDVKEELKTGQVLSAISNQAADEFGDLLNPSNQANQHRKKKKSGNRGMMEKDYGSDSEDEKDDSFESGPGLNDKNIIRDDESDNSGADADEKSEKLIRITNELVKNAADK